MTVYPTSLRTPQGPNRIDLPDHSRITQAKVVKAASFSLGALSSIGGVVSLFSQEKKQLSLPLFISSAGLIYFASNYKDDQNLEESEVTRENGQIQTFSNSALNYCRRLITTIHSTSLPTNIPQEPNPIQN